jgi:hypothetical protein
LHFTPAMKKQTKTLTLKHDTLRRLTSDEMSHAAGGTSDSQVIISGRSMCLRETLEMPTMLCSN